MFHTIDHHFVPFAHDTTHLHTCADTAGGSGFEDDSNVGGMYLDVWTIVWWFWVRTDVPLSQDGSGRMQQQAFFLLS